LVTKPLTEKPAGLKSVEHKVIELGFSSRYRFKSLGRTNTSETFVAPPPTGQPCVICPIEAPSRVQPSPQQSLQLSSSLRASLLLADKLHNICGGRPPGLEF
jgi:hypothetical protein